MAFAASTKALGRLKMENDKPLKTPTSATSAAKAVLVILAVADGLVCFAIVLDMLAPSIGGFLHLSLVAIGTIRARFSIRGDSASQTIGLLVTLLAGPLGLLSYIFVTLVDRRNAPSHGTLDAWYKRISGEEPTVLASRLHDHFATGRSFQPGQRHERQFSEVMTRGAMSEKQSLLGLIGLKYHSSYAPLLAMALKAPEGSVRAQAAAVFVKMKLENRLKLARIVKDSRRHDLSAQVSEILSCTRSGFLDRAEMARGLAVARANCEQAIRHNPTDEVAAALLCEVLAANSDHEAVVCFLESQPHPKSSALIRIYLSSLMALGRHGDLRHYLLQESLLRHSIAPHSAGA